MKLLYFKYQIEKTFVPNEMMKDAGMFQRQQLNKDLGVHAQKNSYIHNFQFIHSSGIFIKCLPWMRTILVAWDASVSKSIKIPVLVNFTLLRAEAIR